MSNKPSSIIINKAKIGRIDPMNVELQVSASVLDKDNDSIPKSEVQLIINRENIGNILSDSDGFIDVKKIVGLLEGENISVQLKEVVSGVKSSVRVISDTIDSTKVDIQKKVITDENTKEIKKIRKKIDKNILNFYDQINVIILKSHYLRDDGNCLLSLIPQIKNEHTKLDIFFEENKDYCSESQKYVFEKELPNKYSELEGMMKGFAGGAFHRSFSKDFEKYQTEAGKRKIGKSEIENFELTHKQIVDAIYDENAEYRYIVNNDFIKGYRQFVDPIMNRTSK